MSNPSSVTVRVPGSTSNCGAGFDTLGLALGIHNTVTLETCPEPGTRPLRDSDAPAQGLVARVLAELEAMAAEVPAGFSYRIDGDVPIARGLGSSITVLAGVLAGLNEMGGRPLSDTDMVRMLTRIEGHPDNATAGVWGGFCVSRCGATAAEFVDVVRREIPDTLKFVVVSPELEVTTKDSRGGLPGELRHGDAVRSINSATFLTAAVVAGEWDKLCGAAEDFIHEPYRLPAIPGAAESIRAGLEVGAMTGWLSGSGSSVLCVAQAETAAAVGAAMLAAFTDQGLRAQVRILAADNTGLQIV